MAWRGWTMAGVLTGATLTLSGCEVDPLESAVQTPAHRAALNAAAGAVPAGQPVQEGQAVTVHQVDGGYVGSGNLMDIDNFRPARWSTCGGASCPKPAGTNVQLTQCVRSGSATVCEDRVDGALEGRVTFYNDQRMMLEALVATGGLEQGQIVSSVWYQNAEQRRRAEQQFSRMMNVFETSFTDTFASVSDERNAPLRAFEAVGEAGLALGAGAGASSGGQGTPSGNSSALACLERTSPRTVANRCQRSVYCRDSSGVAHEIMPASEAVRYLTRMEGGFPIGGAPNGRTVFQGGSFTAFPNDLNGCAFSPVASASQPAATTAPRGRTAEEAFRGLGGGGSAGGSGSLQ